MAIITNDAKTGVSELVVHSIGISPMEFAKKGYIAIVAYMINAEQEIRFTALEFSQKKLLTRESILNGIANAENVKRVSYIDEFSLPKDIYVCRKDEGEIIDVVDRDYEHQTFGEDFAEIASVKTRFVIKDYNAKEIKAGRCFKYDIEYSFTHSGYEENSNEYAILNAYNSCLLGKAFCKEELRLSTKDGSRVKLEVKRAHSFYYDSKVLYLKPEVNSENLLDYYLTEEFNYVDGAELLSRTFKLQFRDKGYSIIRANR